MWKFGHHTVKTVSVHGTIIKLTPKHIAMALDLDSDIPLHRREWTYVLPKHLQLLDPESLSDENESDGYLYGIF